MDLTLAQRRTLAAKFIAHAAFGHPSGDVSYDAVRLAGIQLISDEANASLVGATSDRLDHFTARTAGYVCDTLSRTPRLQICDKSREALANLKSRAEAISCEACALAARARICDGSAEDDMTVVQGGYCVAPLKALLEAVIETARAYYELYCPDFFDRHQSPATSYCVRSYPAGGRDKPHQIPVPVYATAETRFDDGDRVKRSEIVLKLSVDLFDLNTQESLAYILLHEAFCHVFQGCAAGQVKRTTATGFDIFSEGWIDSLISEIFLDFRLGKSPRQEFNQILAGQGQICAGIEMQEARANTARVPMSLFAPYVARGRAVANWVRTALSDRLGPEASRHAFFQLSLGINLLLEGADQRNALVHNLMLAIQGSVNDAAKVGDALSQFADDRTTSNFISKFASK